MRILSIRLMLFYAFALICAFRSEGYSATNTSAGIAKKSLSDNYFSKSWNLLPTSSFDAILNKGLFISEEDKKHLIDLAKNTAPSKLQMIDVNIEALQNSDPHGDVLLLMLDLKKQLQSQRMRLFSKTMECLAGEVSINKGEANSTINAYLDIYKWLSNTASRDEAASIAVILPLFYRNQLLVEFFCGVRTLNKYLLLKNAEALPNQQEIMGILLELASSALPTDKHTGISTWDGSTARALIIEANKAYGIEIAKKLLQGINDTASLTELYNKLPDALSVYAETIDSQLLPEVFRIGGIVQKRESSNLKKTFFWHLCKIGGKMAKYGQNHDFESVLSFLRNGRDGRDPEWKDFCNMALKTLESGRK